jgi:GT2 family glycosyltransferase
MDSLSTTPEVYIIVLSWNQYEFTRECIQSLLRIQYSCKIVVVDNASVDQTPMLLQKEFGGVIHIIQNQSNLGFAAGNNVGITFALEHGAEMIMLLNNDTIVTDTFLEPMVTAMISDSSLAAITPKILFLYQNNKIWSVGGDINWLMGAIGNRGFNRLDIGQYDQSRYIDYAPGCCLLVSRNAFECVGLLDPHYFAYFEDTDWCLRARAQGYKIFYESHAKIWHIAGASSRTTINKISHGRTSAYVYYLTTRNNLWVIRKYTKGVTQFFSIVAFFVRQVLFYMLVFMLVGRFEKLKSLWRGLFDGLKAMPTR